MEELTSAIPILIGLKREYRIKCTRKPKITAIKIILKKGFSPKEVIQIWEEI